MNAVIWGVSSRNRVRRPWESMATPGQNASSKRKNTFRRAITRFRCAKAQVRVHSARSPSTGRSAGGPSAALRSASELNEHLLEIGLVHPAVAHDHTLLVQPAQDLGQALLDRVHRGLHGIAVAAHIEHARQLREPGGLDWVELERDHLAETDLA